MKRVFSTLFPALVILAGSTLRAEDLASLLPVAERGDIPAMLKMAGLYAGQKDFKKAGQWYKKAAEKGNPLAMYRLGVLYEKGLGLSKPDLDRALAWYQKSAVAGFEKAADRLKVMPGAKTQKPPTELVLQPHQMLMNPLSPEAAYMKGFEELAAGKVQKGLALLEDSGSRHFIPALGTLGILFREGSFPGLGDFPALKDHKKANEWLEKGANLGCVHCQFLLADQYSKGQGVTQDFVKSLFWLDRIINETGKQDQKVLAEAFGFKGLQYMQGQGVEKDPVTARELFTRARDLGSPGAAKYLAALDAETPP